MRSIHLLLIAAYLFVAPWSTMAQDTSSCDCPSAFDQITHKLEQDYIGYALRKSELQPELQARINEFRPQVADTNTLKCVRTLQRFLSFFHDGHLFVSQFPNYPDSENQAFKTYVRQRRYDISRVTARLAARRAKLKDIEGVWTDGSTRFAVISNDDKRWPYQFVAVILNAPDSTKMGELKFGVNIVDGEYVGVYYSNGYSPRYVQISPARDNTLLGIWGGLLWGRVSFSDEQSIVTQPLYDPSRPTLAQLGDSTVLITLPTFLIDKPVLDSVLMADSAALTSCRMMIIDIRGNSGGNGIYFDLIQLFAERPLRSEIGLALASEDNIAYFKKFAQNNADDPYRPVVEDMEKNPGQIIRGPRFSDSDSTETHFALAAHRDPD